MALTRRGNPAAFETLVARYRARLLAFCRHMVGSSEDAEDILQEVFVAAYRAMLADERDINVRPWLYRIARNRCLNHLRRPRPTGVDSMDIYEGGAAAATADRVHDKLELEDLIGDVKQLPETQRTALLLREMGALSYDQIAVAMDTSIPSVKSLLVRARVALAEAAESRKLTCDEVRIELAAVAEGIKKMSPPVRRHVGDCERCRAFKKELSISNRKLAVLAPIGPLLLLKHAVALKLLGVGSITGLLGLGGGSAGAGAGAAAAGAGAGAGATAGATAGAGAAGAGIGLGSIAGPAVAGLATVAIAVGGVSQVTTHHGQRHHLRRAAAALVPATGVGVKAHPLPGSVATTAHKPRRKHKEPAKPAAVEPTAATGTTTPANAPTPDQPSVIDDQTMVVTAPLAEPTAPVVAPPTGQTGATPTPPTGPSAPVGQSAPSGPSSQGAGGTTSATGSPASPIVGDDAGPTGESGATGAS